MGGPRPRPHMMGGRCWPPQRLEGPRGALVRWGAVAAGGGAVARAGALFCAGGAPGAGRRQGGPSGHFGRQGTVAVTFPPTAHLGMFQQKQGLSGSGLNPPSRWVPTLKMGRVTHCFCCKGPRGVEKFPLGLGTRKPSFPLRHPPWGRTVVARRRAATPAIFICGALA
jgi:hypothetical protein